MSSTRPCHKGVLSMGIAAGDILPPANHNLSRIYSLLRMSQHDPQTPLKPLLW